MTLQPGDHELIDSYRRGDAAALDALLRRHLPRVRGIVFPMVLDDATADDLTQEAFLRALRGLDGFAGGAQFSTWLYRITLNLVYTHLDRQQRMPQPVPPERSACWSARAHEGPEPAVASIERSKAVEQALAELPPKLRAALVLTRLEGKTAAQAAELEGCPPGTIYRRVHEARTLLRKRLGDLLL